MQTCQMNRKKKNVYYNAACAPIGSHYLMNAACHIIEVLTFLLYASISFVP